MRYKTPPPLSPGDQVALIAPASRLNDETPVKKAEQLLREWDLEPVRGQYIMERHHGFAGTDHQRLKDLQEALDNPAIKAIWMLRGGYGMMRILPMINMNIFRARPKWIIGFSDITAFHNLVQLSGFKSIHAIMPQQFVEGVSDEAKESLRQALTGEKYRLKRNACTLDNIGSAQGVLTGGNLSLITSLLGTQYKPDYTKKILFLEEVGEPLYKIDRMLQSLEMAGVFREIAGLVVGAFSEIKKEHSNSEERTHHQLFAPYISKYNFPVLFDLPAGHIPDNRALILGDTVDLNVGEFVGCLRFNEYS